MRAAFLVPFLLAGCNTLSSGPGAADFVGADVEVTPGLASCVTAIGRPDLAVDPSGPMSNQEIEDLLACTAERASR
ncbi:hypothetical protein [Jannaschia sp. M317]|uniref:hypothetical protein n=1 Tax=Jannaschia sp. M317 TaxID=2867011 RepID=UPI0021A6C786|nr:hypothetical protein [Jannaschia sp. M317]UWQ18013.1 hypothetical protein K3551_01515 [Jannaschia sp. M317]